jgi:hypothetical protein
MKFELERLAENGSLIFHGRVSKKDMTELTLDRLDRALLDDVGSDTKATAADYLLVLEMLFRRHHEQSLAKENGNG